MFDADTGAVVFAYNELDQAISVSLPVDNQVGVCVHVRVLACVCATVSAVVELELTNFFMHLGLVWYKKWECLDISR